MATRRDFTLSVGGMYLECFLNERQEVVVTINDCTDDYMSINICDIDDLVISAVINSNNHFFSFFFFFFKLGIL